MRLQRAACYSGETSRDCAWLISTCPHAGRLRGPNHVSHGEFCLLPSSTAKVVVAFRTNPGGLASHLIRRGDFAKHSPPIVLRWMLLPVGSTDPAYSDPLGVHGPGPKEYIAAGGKPLRVSGSIVKCSNERLPLHETSYCGNTRTVPP